LKVRRKAGSSKKVLRQPRIDFDAGLHVLPGIKDAAPVTVVLGNIKEQKTTINDMAMVSTRRKLSTVTESLTACLDGSVPTQSSSYTIVHSILCCFQIMHRIDHGAHCYLPSLVTKPSHTRKGSILTWVRTSLAIQQQSKSAIITSYINEIAIEPK